MFKELNEILGRVKHEPSRVVIQELVTTDTSGDETDASRSRTKVRSKRIYKMNKVWGQMRWATSSSVGQRTQPVNPVSVTAAYAEKTVSPY